MNPSLDFLPEARSEFDEAADWYEQQARSGADFIRSVSETFERIVAHPSGHPVVHQDTRRARASGHPYSVIYRIAADQIIVISVFHGSRNPSMWQSRV